MAYATVEQVEDGFRELKPDETSVCTALLDEAAIIIDAYNADAPADVKRVVSCRIIRRAIGAGEASVPIGATQGSQSALGYVQSWTVSSGGTVGELYVSRADRRLLGLGNAIGGYSPTQELVPVSDPEEVTP